MVMFGYIFFVIVLLVAVAGVVIIQMCLWEGSSVPFRVKLVQCVGVLVLFALFVALTWWGFDQTLLYYRMAKS